MELTLDEMYSPDRITYLNRNEVFVFGSNRAGRHGKGAALLAVSFGAEYGRGEGHFGRTYALPTKDENLRVLTLGEIEKHVETFKDYARELQNLDFLLTPIGCGLAGYTPESIAPLFIGSPDNVFIPRSFGDVIDRINPKKPDK